VITDAKFYGNRLRGFGVTGPPRRHFLYLTFIALTTVSALPCCTTQCLPETMIIQNITENVRPKSTPRTLYTVCKTTTFLNRCKSCGKVNTTAHILQQESNKHFCGHALYKLTIITINIVHYNTVCKVSHKRYTNNYYSRTHSTEKARY